MQAREDAGGAGSRSPRLRLIGTRSEASTTVSPSPGPTVAYPGYDVLSQQAHWDDATREVIRRRLEEVPRIRFFDERETRMLQALADRVLPQDDRVPEERIPIVPWIDRRCFLRITDGFRFDNMPPDEEAWRLGLRGIDETAEALYQTGFLELDSEQQDTVLRSIADGDPPGTVWKDLPAERFWIYVVLRQITSIYFAHPYAWNEIGFGGPAYPRGYAALNHGQPEPWEVREVRLDASRG